MIQTIKINGEDHVVRQCGSCAVWHAFPKIIYDSYRAEGGFWYCPNGHQRGFQKGANEIEQENTRRERDRLKQDAARMADELAAERTRAERAEQKVLQIKRRANAGRSSLPKSKCAKASGVGAR